MRYIIAFTFIVLININFNDGKHLESIREKRSYKFGDFLLKPAIRTIFGSKEEMTTTPYPYANYAFSPGYYQDSLGTCSNAALRDSNSMLITCKRNGFEISCNENLYQHDIAVIKCKEGYSLDASIKSEIECMPSGRWSDPIYECVPSCGRVTKKATALIIHGTDTDVSEFPWNVAVYRGDLLICGGTIISERVILSAAHCFTRETANRVERLRPQEFQIVVGKYFRDMNAAENDECQHFTPTKIKIHDTYFGFSGNYDADIAIVTLNKSIIYKSHIAPVCLDLNLRTIAEKQPPPHGSLGMLAGYGYTEVDGKPSDKLKKIELPVVNIRTCKQEAPDSFKPFVTSDKFCAGYNDGRGAVCKGDSGKSFKSHHSYDKIDIKSILGAGLVFPKAVNDENIYSASPKKNSV